MVNSNYKSQKNSSNIERESNDTHKYKMKLEKFQGNADEDFDLWCEDLRAFFALYNFNEEDQVLFINAHIVGAARRVV